jgi:phospholipid/cholesterol/gamma-HCH transport system permease protein
VNQKSKIMSWFSGTFSKLGSIVLFDKKILTTALSTKNNGRAICTQILEVTQRTFWTVAFSGVFVGAILVLQFYSMLQEQGAESLLGGLNTSAIIREVGPLIISFLIAGKIGAFTAAELGTMRVTDQISAMECLGADPYQHLILPRFAAIIISSVVLLLIGMMISILGSMWVASVFCGVNPLQYIESISKFTDAWTLFCGITKCEIYALIVATMSCYEGFHASNGAQGVGQAVTRTAVMTNLFIVLANYFSSRMLDAVGIVLGV